MTRKPARAFLAVLLTLTAVLAGCGTTGDQRVFGAQSVPLGQSLAVLGWMDDIRAQLGVRYPWE